MAQPLSFRWDEGFVARIDEARGLVPRSAFVRRAVDQAIGTPSKPTSDNVRKKILHLLLTADANDPDILAREIMAVVESPATLGILTESGDSIALRATYTADQLDDLAARRVSEISPARSTAQVKRDVQPRPKGKR